MSTSITGRPGIFVTESLTPLTTAPTVPSQAVAAFIGTHNAGPIGPTLVTSWAQWRTLFGGFGNGSDLLPFAIYQFFANSGGQAYVIRAVAPDAVQASVTLNDLGTGGSGGITPQPLLVFTAAAPGVVGNDIFIDVISAGSSTGRFNLIIRVGSATATPVEQYVDVTLDPQDGRYLIAMLSAVNSGSKYVTAAYEGIGPWDYRFTPGNQSGTPLTGGLDGTASIDLVAATRLLDSIDGILDINLPGVSDPLVINPLISWAAAADDRFLVVDAPAASAVLSDTVTAYRNLSPLGTSSGTPYTSSSYLSVYGPWITVADPSAQAVGATRLLPPGGSMLGLYAQADQLSGPQQSAAGPAFPIAGALNAQVKFLNSDLDTFNMLGINIIRRMSANSGVVPMGVRTLSNGMPDRYLSIRRTLMYVTHLCVQATQFAVFRPNNPDLWGQITSILNDELATLQQSGMLKGATASEAFSVLCNSTNNTTNSTANGVVNIEVGVALNTPGEYILIQIGQLASGAITSNSLTG